MEQLEMIERALARPAYLWDGGGGEPGEEEAIPPPDDDDDEDQVEPMGSVGWRDVCKSYVALDRNWRFGRCRERYLTPPGNSVWRIKLDSENQTLLASDRTGESPACESVHTAILTRIQGASR